MKYLGIDFGLKRVGLATSEGELSSPWKILEVRNFSDAVSQILKIIKEEKFDKIVVGLPEGKMGQNVIGFTKALSQAGIIVETCDETLSSQKAKKLMVEQGIKQKDRYFEDAYSADGILQDYLDSI